MIVTHLFRKDRRGAPMAAVDAIEAVAGLGLEGDCQREASSPRQVLLFDRRLLDEHRLRPDDVRANVLVEGAIDALASGTRVRLGPEIVLRLTMPCEPCRKLETLERGLARKLVRRRGMLARIVRGGVARVGDVLTFTPGVFPPLHDMWQDRVAEIVRRLPEGMVLGHARLARMAGVESAYCRAFPRLLQKLRVERSMPQAERVLAQGSSAARGLVGAATQWDGSSYYRTEELTSDGT